MLRWMLRVRAFQIVGEDGGEGRQEEGRREGRSEDNGRRQRSGGADDTLDCGDGRVVPARQQFCIVPCPIGGELRGRATSCAARVWTTLQRERTASGVATMTGGADNGDIDIEVLAVRATHCQQWLLPREAARVGRGG